MARDQLALINAHGIISVVAWILLAPTAIFCAANLSWQLPKYTLWIHLVLSVFVWLINLVAVIIGAAGLNFNWVYYEIDEDAPPENYRLQISHGVLGYITIGFLGILFPIMTMTQGRESNFPNRQ